MEDLNILVSPPERSQIIFYDATLTQPKIMNTRRFPPKEKLLHQILTYNILLRDGHRDGVTPIDQLVMTYIFSNRPISISDLILSKMKAAALNNRKTVHLPFGMLLTTIFVTIRFSLSNEVLVEDPSNSNFNQDSLLQMR